MTDLEKYELINSTKYVSELVEAIEKIGPVKGTKREYSVDELKAAIDIVKQHPYYPYLNTLTRTYGIRQQMLYLVTYRKLDKPVEPNVGSSFETENN